METKITNKHGEIIHIKLDGNIIMVHHMDCTENYITFDELVLKYIVEIDEIILILNTARQLYLPTVLENIKDKF